MVYFAQKIPRPRLAAGPTKIVYIFYTIYFAIVLHSYDILLYFNILYNFFNTGMEPAVMEK